MSRLIRLREKLDDSGMLSKKDPKEARHQLKLNRPAFIRNCRESAKDPVHALGMLFMKACKFGAVRLGLLASAGDNEPKKNIEHTSSYKQNSSSRRQRLKKKTTRKISPKVFVIVLNFNGIKYLKSCLPSLMSQTYSNYQVIVCDNASTDGSANYVKLNFPSAILIQNRENLGFSKGNNKALKLALDQGADYLQLFNNDTIAEKDVIESLVKTAESNEEIGIVGPKILDFKNRTLIQEMGMTCDKFGFPAAMKTRRESVLEAFYVSGCAMLIKQEVLRKIGGFDEKYFMFSEDLDLCWRTQLAGYTVVVNKAAKVYHASGGSIIGGAIKNGTYTTTLKRVYLRERNTLRTLTKNYSIANLIKIIPVYLVMLSLECFIWACLLKPGVSTSLLKGSWWNIKVLRDTLTQRQKIQIFRKIADKQIIRKIIKGYAKLQVFRLFGIPRVLES